MAALTPFRTALLEPAAVVTATGTVAVTLDDFGVAAAGSVTYTGTLARTVDDFTVAASASVTYTGIVAVTLADFTVAGVATVPVTIGTVNTAARNLTQRYKARGLTT